MSPGAGHEECYRALRSVAFTHAAGSAAVVSTCETSALPRLSWVVSLHSFRISASKDQARTERLGTYYDQTQI